MKLLLQEKILIDQKTINETYGSEGYHYVIYNGDTGNPIFEKGQWGYPNYPHSIYILDRRFIINDEQVNNLLKAYKINRSIDDIKRSKDTIHLTSYDKFRKEYPNFIQKMDVVPDSLFMRVVSEKGEIKRIRKKIEWQKMYNKKLLISLLYVIQLVSCQK